MTCLSAREAHVFERPHKDPCQVARLGSIAKSSSPNVYHFEGLDINTQVTAI